jgi:hypothetical protein
MINFINEFVYFDNKRIPSVDSVKSSSNSTNDPMFNPKTGKQLKNSAVQNKTQSGYRKFPYSLLPLAVTSSNAVSYMSDTENVDDEYWNRIDELLNDDMSISKRSEYDYAIIKEPKTRINKVKQYLIKIDIWGKLSYEKFIPDCYKFNSTENRIKLLRGLMDTDGSVSKDGTFVSFTSTSLLRNDSL